MGWCHAELGEFSDALAIEGEAVRIAEAVDHPFSVALALFGLGYARVRRGDFLHAIAALERAVAIGRAWQLESQLPAHAATLGYAYALTGRVAEALPLLQEALKSPLVNLALCTSFLGEAHLLAGNRDEALSVARQALALAHDRKERGHEAWALRLLGEIHAHRDPPEVQIAETHYQESLALAEELGMRPLAAHCHLGLGTLAGRMGDSKKACEDLSTAAGMYREMGMTFWLEKAEAALERIG